jgi:hypothetical protein
MFCLFLSRSERCSAALPVPRFTARRNGRISNNEYRLPGRLATLVGVGPGSSVRCTKAVATADAGWRCFMAQGSCLPRLLWLGLFKPAAVTPRSKPEPRPKDPNEARRQPQLGGAVPAPTKGNAHAHIRALEGALTSFGGDFLGFHQIVAGPATVLIVMLMVKILLARIDNPKRRRHDRRRMNTCENGVSMSRCARTEPLNYMPDDCWRESRTPNADDATVEGAIGHD